MKIIYFKKKRIKVSADEQKGFLLASRHVRLTGHGKLKKHRAHPGARASLERTADDARRPLNCALGCLKWFRKLLTYISGVIAFPNLGFNLQKITKARSERRGEESRGPEFQDVNEIDHFQSRIQEL